MPIPQAAPAEQRQGVGTALHGAGPAGTQVVRGQSPQTHTPSHQSHPLLRRHCNPGCSSGPPAWEAPLMATPSRGRSAPLRPAPFSPPPGAHAQPGGPHRSPTLSLPEIHPIACLTLHCAPRIIFLHLVAGLANQHSRCSTKFELQIYTRNIFLVSLCLLHA